MKPDMGNVIQYKEMQNIRNWKEEQETITDLYYESRTYH